MAMTAFTRGSNGGANCDRKTRKWRTQTWYHCLRWGVLVMTSSHMSNCAPRATCPEIYKRRGGLKGERLNRKSKSDDEEQFRQ